MIFGARMIAICTAEMEVYILSYLGNLLWCCPSSLRSNCACLRIFTVRNFGGNEFRRRRVLYDGRSVPPLHAELITSP